MDELDPLKALARAMGVATSFTDGLGRHVEASPETLTRVCAALGAELHEPSDASDALKAWRSATSRRLVPPVIVAWDGSPDPIDLPEGQSGAARIHLEDGGTVDLELRDGALRAPEPLPMGYHRITVEAGGRQQSGAVISAPEHAWRRPGEARSWGIGTHLAALRSARSRSLGDLWDLESVCRWVGAFGGDLVTVLPLLPTFNGLHPEPSPYSPVSRLFWSELVLDLGAAHRAVKPPARLDVSRGDAEVRAALAGAEAPDPDALDAELVRYARFRGAQARLGRDWRQWPEGARNGELDPDLLDWEEARFHLVAQTVVREQLEALHGRLDRCGVRLGLDLAVGVHPDGYDPWSRPHLFALGMSVGAPPDGGFPSGQDWGFPPVLPGASRDEGHRYLAASVAHQAALAGVLRIDHIMAMTRLYWIPHGHDLADGTYVSYPADELFAILTLESHRHRCELVGENLGTVPREIDEALPRHRIWGMFLAEFEAGAEQPRPPSGGQVAMVGTHDTPTFAGWLDEIDIDERVRVGLLDAAAAPDERRSRSEAARRLAWTLKRNVEDPDLLLAELTEWLGRSPSPLVILWLEDLWMEDQPINIPGTRSDQRPNWQRPMSRLLDQVTGSPEVLALLRRLDRARRDAPA